MREKILVDFFIVGAPKCGTSAFASYLDSHPDVCFSRPKETHFFDKEMVLPRLHDGVSLDSYHSTCFSHYDPKRHKILGEGTPAYLRYPEALKRINAYNEKARFVVLVRNPVEMAQALHSQNLFNGFENEPNFEKAWNLQGDRRQGVEVPERCQNIELLLYKDICSLGKQVSSLLEIVERERVHIIIFDDFVRDPRREYLNLLGFLGIRDDGRSVFEKVNQNKRWRFFWCDPFFRFLGMVKRSSGVFRSLGVASKIKNILVKRAVRTEISTELRLEMKRSFEDDVILLSQLLRRDLIFWVR